MFSTPRLCRSLLGLSIYRRRGWQRCLLKNGCRLLPESFPAQEAGSVRIYQAMIGWDLGAERDFLLCEILKFFQTKMQEQNTSSVFKVGVASCVSWLSPPLLLAEIGSFSWDSSCLIFDINRRKHFSFLKEMILYYQSTK